MSENSEGKELGFFARIALFYRQVINELRKVVWPSRNMLTTYTGVVLVFVSFIIAVVSLSWSNKISFLCIRRVSTSQKGRDDERRAISSSC